MSKKDEASPRQRITMEERWDKARRDCAYERCKPAYRFHAAGCPRRAQKVKVTNLNTGETSEATTVKEAMDANAKQAVRLEPVFDRTYWDAFERGMGPGRQTYSYGGVAEQQDVPEVDTSFPPVLGTQEPSPARPWWKFWGRRG